MPTLLDIDLGVKEGDVLAGKYRVERLLGVGGMGVVVAAQHIQLDERVALKFLLPEALKMPDCIARFEREARAAVKIKSEHVARVIDVGELEGGSPYMVMEYLEGGDLLGWLENHGRLPIEQAVDFVLQACEAIAEAHLLGIVHRDLKPANLFCIRRPDGQLSIKVLDFGISKMSTVENLQMTGTSVVFGSPVYMSPEQMQASKDVDRRTDVWSLGVILYELLAGRVPFDTDSVTELAIRVATEPTPSITALRPEVPSGLEAAIRKCLEKRRESRFEDVDELAVAIAPFGSRHGQGSLERIQGTLESLRPSSQPVVRSRPPPGSSTHGGWQFTGRHPARGRTIVGVMAAGVATVVFAAMVLLRGAPLPSALGAAPRAAATLPAPQHVTPTPPLDLPSPVVLAPEPAPLAMVVAPSSAPAPVALASAPPRPVLRALVRPKAATPGPSAFDCDPPFYFDAQGNRVFKPECL